MFHGDNVVLQNLALMESLYKVLLSKCFCFCFTPFFIAPRYIGQHLALMLVPSENKIHNRFIPKRADFLVEFCEISTPYIEKNLHY